MSSKKHHEAGSSEQLPFSDEHCSDSKKVCLGHKLSICLCIYLFATRLQLQKDAKTNKQKNGIKLMLNRPPQLQFFEDGIKITAKDTNIIRLKIKITINITEVYKWTFWEIQVGVLRLAWWPMSLPPQSWSSTLFKVINLMPKTNNLETSLSFGCLIHPGRLSFSWNA